ncbi:hypothetical protein [Avibacterium sp. 21-599]|uniref:hypothetical protein n=1 Tax=Avibacterium sp. 21-599 TaxID=2911528 RepID=UPI0022482C34|nr:hypothetical protein [Avibacterium sp. 21-599]MCW9716993.1 hypothetical protein [Avibacterium sp. 21-599]
MNKLDDLYSKDEIENIINNIYKYIIIDEDTDCFIWTHSMNGILPYYYLRKQDKVISISVRLFLLMYENPNIYYPKWLVIRENCQNPKCVNPYHLKIKKKKEFTGKTKIKIAKAIIFYKENVLRLKSNAAIAEKLGISAITLSKYLKEYRKKPEEWDEIINKIIK